MKVLCLVAAILASSNTLCADQPFSLTRDFPSDRPSSAGGGASVLLPLPPSGNRTVIEYLTVYCDAPDNTDFTIYSIITVLGTTTADNVPFSIPVPKAGLGLADSVIYQTSQETKIYSLSDGKIQIGISYWTRGTSSRSPACSISISGYYSQPAAIPRRGL
jgi:hypothetical protein